MAVMSDQLRTELPGEIAAAPWIRAQARRLLAQRGHAWLLHGPSGLGQYALALRVAKAWLCESPQDDGPCGLCGSCHAVNVRTHADLLMLMPETSMQTLDWPLGEKAQAELDDRKRKPGKEIRIDAMREAIEFAQRTSAWGRGKAIVVYPAERMNAVTANALLKTLEEPAGDLKFVVASEAVHQLLPTIRSRCLQHAMAWPEPAAAVGWMMQQGLAQPAAQTLLRAAGGRPDDALRLAGKGLDARAWALLPKAVQRGDISLMREWSAAEIVQTLLKICHDLQSLGQGAQPRFFEATDLPRVPPLPALGLWTRDLLQTARTVEHPFHPGLMLDALASRAQSALNSDQ